MRWNIAQAKQQFSEVVRHSKEEPQLICNRGKAVAAMVDAETFMEFMQWRKREAAHSLGSSFSEFRKICAEENYEFSIPPRRDRENPFAGMNELPD